MPDPNKHKALKMEGFRIQPTCSTCVHWTEERVANWGYCGLIFYEHRKHGQRQAGTPDVGWCRKYTPDAKSMPLRVGQDYVERYAKVRKPETRL